MTPMLASALETISPKLTDGGIYRKSVVGCQAGEVGSTVVGAGAPQMAAGGSR
jgi:hypothetical protein